MILGCDWFGYFTFERGVICFLGERGVIFGLTETNGCLVYKHSTCTIESTRSYEHKLGVLTSTSTQPIL